VGHGFTPDAPSSSLRQMCAHRRGLVGNDAIDAPGDEEIGLIQVVDGPSVNSKLMRMCYLDKLLRQYWDMAADEWNLDCLSAICGPGYCSK
jgi:hypothetical protein